MAEATPELKAGATKARVIKVDAAPLWQTPARFLSVGFVCAAVHNLIVIGAGFAHVHYAVACVISYIVVVVLGFALHVRFTFEVKPTFAAFARYALSMAANYPITLALLFLMSDLAHWPLAIAAPLATAALFVWNYAASRWAIAGTAASSATSAEAPATSTLPAPTRQA